jgi:hypothetical protein
LNFPSITCLMRNMLKQWRKLRFGSRKYPHWNATYGMPFMRRQTKATDMPNSCEIIA